MKLHIPEFGGIAPALDPRDLPDYGAQIAANIEHFGGVLSPMRGVSETPEAAFGFQPGTLYRFGETIEGGTPVWWAWENPNIDVVRTQIAGDAEEWTFWTGESSADDPLVTTDGMRGTYKGFALAADAHGPERSFAMGLPAPTQPIAAGAEVPDVRVPAVITIPEASAWYDSIYAYTEAGFEKYINFALSTGDGERAGWVFGGFTFQALYPGLEGRLVLDHTYSNGLEHLAAMLGAAHGVEAHYDDHADVLAVWSADRGATASLALTYGRLDPKNPLAWDGLSLSDFPLTDEGKPSDEDFYKYFEEDGRVFAVGNDGNAGVIESRVYTYTRVYKSATGYEIESPPAPIGEQSTVDVYPVHNSANPVPETDGQSYANRSAMRPVWLGEFYPHDVEAGSPKSDFWNAAVSLDIGVFAIRIYRATAGQYLLVDELEYTAEGALLIEVNDAGEDIVQPATNMANGLPYYRPGSSEGGNGDHTDAYDPALPIYNYIDRKQASELELTALPSLTWSPPPAGLRGLVNLSNGIMAGFVGRDVFFSEPYRPHAWPLQYSQTVDFSVVALAAMDTTLVVLTEGTPYFIQGAHPEMMTVVQGQLKQACVSKRSVVSFPNAVLYASPDGLVQISPNGSSVLTSAIIKPQQWRSSYSPGTIKGFDYEGQYVAFWDALVGGMAGFIYDPTVQRFVHHTYADVTGGYHDRRDGSLFLAKRNGVGGQILAWDANEITREPAHWRSKVVTLPGVTSFAWAQVDASAYTPLMTFQLYVNGKLAYTFSPTSREPFRLPPTPGREVYVDLSGVRVTVYAVTLTLYGRDLRDYDG